MTQPGAMHCLQAAHPMFAGHFPGDPLLPGAYLLALVLEDAHAWLADHDPGCRAGGVRAAKFTQPIRPGQSFRCEFRAASGNVLRFAVTGQAGCTHASGTLELVRPGAGDAPVPDLREGSDESDR